VTPQTADLEGTRAVAEALGMGLAVVDAHGIVQVANERAAALSGLPPEEWAQSDWINAWGPVVDGTGRPLPRHEWPLVRCLRHGERSERVLLGRPHADGIRWLSVTTIPMKDPRHPGMRSAIMLLDDVTGQQRDAQQLRRARALLASAFEASPLAMVLGERNGRIVGANAAFARFARPGADGARQPWWSFVDPDDRPELFRRLDAVIATGDGTLELECRCTDGDGEPVAVRIFGASVANEPADGRAPLVTVQISDITELRRSEARYRTLAETVPCGIFEIDRSGRLADATALTDAILAGGASVVGRPADEFVHPAHRPLVHLHFARALAGHNSSAQFRLVFGGEAVGRPPGSEMIALACFRPLIGPDGQVERVIGTVLDLTEQLQLQERLRELGRDIEFLAAEQARERLEAQLAQAQRFESLGRLAGGVAHDFNNLLGVISNYAGFLAKQRDLPDALRADVDQIAEAARRGAAVTRQLLQFARREQLRPARFDLGEMLGELAAMLSGPLRPAVELAVDAEPGSFVEADRGQLEQMVLNLLINARDALPDGGTVTLCCRRRDAGGAGGPAHIELTVRDDGVGMTPEVQARVFEPFFTTKPRSEASGLGMASVQGIVEQAGGRVELSSAPGEGTTVTVRLPAA